jgi:uncharacterized protein YceK
MSGIQMIQYLGLSITRTTGLVYHTELVTQSSLGSLSQLVLPQTSSDETGYLVYFSSNIDIIPYMLKTAKTSVLADIPIAFVLDTLSLPIYATS